MSWYRRVIPHMFGKSRAVVRRCSTRGSSGSRNRGRAAVLLAMVALLATACGSGGSGSSHPGSSSSLTNVKVAVLPKASNDSFNSLFAAHGLGIDKKNGINLQFVTVESGSALVTSVVSGTTNYGQAPLASVVQAIEHGSNLEVLGVAEPTSAGFILESRAGSGITKVSQLADKQICVTESGSETYYAAEYISAINHLNATIVPVGSNGLQSTLLSGRAAACIVTSPQSYDLLSSKQAVELVSVANVMNFWSVWFAIKGYAGAHKKVTDELLQTWFDTIAKEKANRGLGVAQFEKYNSESASVANSQYQRVLLTPTNPALNLAKVKTTYAILQDSGVNISDLPPESSLVTNTYANINGTP